MHTRMTKHSSADMLSSFRGEQECAVRKGEDGRVYDSNLSNSDLAPPIGRETGMEERYNCGNESPAYA